MWVLHRDVILCSLQAMAYLLRQAPYALCCRKILGLQHSFSLLLSIEFRHWGGSSFTDGTSNTDVFRYQHHLEHPAAQPTTTLRVSFSNPKLPSHISRLHDTTRDAFPFVASNLITTTHLSETTTRQIDLGLVFHTHTPHLAYLA